MITLTQHLQGVIITIRAQPGAKRDAVLGERNGALRVAVTAAPERGKANEAIAVVLAEFLGCKYSQVTLLSGETSRNKRFLIEGMTTEAVAIRAGTPGAIQG